MKTATVTYILVNNLGGITSMLSNLINYRGPEALPQEAVILDIRENVGAPISSSFGNGIPVKHFSYSKRENWYHVFGRLAKLIGNNPGVIVCNDVYEMLMLQAFRVNKKVVQIVHDAYNVQLALLYGEVVDRFICHSFFYYEVMCQLIPHRKKDIIHLPYGIPLSGVHRKSGGIKDPLRLVFLGRHDTQKGIFDLYDIEQKLLQANINVQWLIMGRGPKTDILKQQWKDKSNVTFDSPDYQNEVMQKIAACDIFVFPTRFEGFPVSLLEAMSVGVVPVVTNLPGGIREVVKDGHNGFLCPESSIHDFADRIIYLDRHREQLEEMSKVAFQQVNQFYNADVQSPIYQQLFNELSSSQDIPAHHLVNRKIGSRLDQPWIPNFISKKLRSIL